MEREIGGRSAWRSLRLRRTKGANFKRWFRSQGNEEKATKSRVKDEGPKKPKAVLWRQNETLRKDRERRGMIAEEGEAGRRGEDVNCEPGDHAGREKRGINWGHGEEKKKIQLANKEELARVKSSVKDRGRKRADGGIRGLEVGKAAIIHHTS